MEESMDLSATCEERRPNRVIVKDHPSITLSTHIVRTPSYSLEDYTHQTRDQNTQHGRISSWEISRIPGKRGSGEEKKKKPGNRCNKTVPDKPKPTQQRLKRGGVGGSYWTRASFCQKRREQIHWGKNKGNGYFVLSRGSATLLWNLCGWKMKRENHEPLYIGFTKLA